jgi:hypothetical protein
MSMYGSEVKATLTPQLSRASSSKTQLTGALWAVNRQTGRYDCRGEDSPRGRVADHTCLCLGVSGDLTLRGPSLFPLLRSAHRCGRITGKPQVTRPEAKTRPGSRMTLRLRVWRNYDDTASVSFIGGHPMNPKSRFALFTVALVTIVAIAYSQPRHGVSLSRSLKDLCVCVPGRAGLIKKAAHAKTQAAVQSPSYETHRRFNTPE